MLSNYIIFKWNHNSYLLAIPIYTKAIVILKLIKFVYLNFIFSCNDKNNPKLSKTKPGRNLQ